MLDHDDGGGGAGQLGGGAVAAELLVNLKEKGTRDGGWAQTEVEHTLVVAGSDDMSELCLNPVPFSLACAINSQDRSDKSCV